MVLGIEREGQSFRVIAGPDPTPGRCRGESRCRKRSVPHLSQVPPAWPAVTCWLICLSRVAGMSSQCRGADWANHPFVCPALVAKKFLFTSEPNHFYIHRCPGPHRGAFRDRHGRRARDAMDAACQKTNDIARGRRSRVVLTPRRWRQASRKYPRGDGGKQARSPGRARNRPLKPLRREGRVFR
jgi:hypothetical protein